MSYRFCWLLASGIRTEHSSFLIPLASSQHNLYDIYLLPCVQCWIPDDGQRNCPKHVEFYSKNIYEKLVLLVGFIIRTGVKVSAKERKQNAVTCVQTRRTAVRRTRSDLHPWNSPSPFEWLYCWLVLGRCQVQTSAGTPAVLTGINNKLAIWSTQP